MRVYGALLLGIVLAALLFAGAGFGASFAGLPDWGMRIDNFGMADIKVSGQYAPGNAIQVSSPEIGTINVSDYLPCPVPLVGTPSDYAAAREMAARLPAPAVADIYLVETPHDTSVKATEAGVGGISDAADVAGQAGTGTCSIGPISLPEPPLPVSLDSFSDEGKDLPMLAAPILFAS